jgi:hypothetical protein
MVMPSEIETVLNSRGVDAGLDVLGERPEVEVARPDLGPRVGDADEGLLQVLVGESDRLHHGAGGGAVRTFGDDVTVAIQLAHGNSAKVRFDSAALGCSRSLTRAGPSAPGRSRRAGAGGWCGGRLAGGHGGQGGE